MRPEEVIVRCPNCTCPMSGHLKSSGACFIENCMCGWEIKDGRKRQKNDPQEIREAKYIFPVKVDPPVRSPGIKEVDKLFPNHPCFFCGEKAESVDHLIPSSRGGSNLVENKVPACHRCNQMKSNMTLEEFAAHCRKIVEALKLKQIIEKDGSVFNAVV